MERDFTVDAHGLKRLFNFGVFLNKASIMTVIKAVHWTTDSTFTHSIYEICSLKRPTPFYEKSLSGRFTLKTNHSENNAFRKQLTNRKNHSHGNSFPGQITHGATLYH